MFNKDKQEPIKTVIRCPENWVMAFDKDGEQIPEYQGQYHLLRDTILDKAPPNAVFAHLLDSEPELRKVPRDKW